MQEPARDRSLWLWILIPIVVIGAVVWFLLTREQGSEFTYRM